MSRTVWSVTAALVIDDEEVVGDTAAILTTATRNALDAAILPHGTVMTVHATDTPEAPTRPSLTIDKQGAYLLSLYGLPNGHHVHYATLVRSDAELVAKQWLVGWNENYGGDWTLYGWTGDADYGWTGIVGHPGADSCPTCEGMIPTNDYPGEYPGALSRRGDFQVCSQCGQREALEDFHRRHP